PGLAASDLAGLLVVAPPRPRRISPSEEPDDDDGWTRERRDPTWPPRALLDELDDEGAWPARDDRLDEIRAWPARDDRLDEVRAWPAGDDRLDQEPTGPAEDDRLEDDQVDQRARPAQDDRLAEAAEASGAGSGSPGGEADEWSEQARGG